MYLLNANFVTELREEFARKKGSKDKKKRAKYLKLNLGYEGRRTGRNIIRATKDNIVPAASIAATVGTSVYLANKTNKANTVKKVVDVAKRNKGKLGAALAAGTVLGGAYLLNKEKNKYDKNPLGYKAKTITKLENENIRTKLRKVGKISNKLLNY